MNKALKIILLAALILILYCSNDPPVNTPESTVEKMKKEACEGDVDGFFSYIDKDAITEDLKKVAMADIERPGNELEVLGQNMGKAFVDKIIPAMLEQIWQGFETAIEEGEQGILCHIKIVGQKNLPLDQLILEGAEGNYMTWGFTKREDKWIVTSFPMDINEKNVQM